MQGALIFVVLLAFCKAQNDAEPTGWTTLTQADFGSGTYRILGPGNYILGEDIWFDAKPVQTGSDAYDSYRVEPKDLKSGGGTYPDLAYEVGFWAAITIEASGVTIDLNGKTIGQSRAHNLMNRYFNVIELASQPFVTGQGFANFGKVGNLAPNSLVSAESVTIKNGKIGRSATHGIHGTGNKNILIQNVVFEQFETAAVSLYGATDVVIEDCTAYGANQVPVNAHFNTALQIRPFIDHLVKYVPNYSINITGEVYTVTDIQASLRQVINTVYDQVITKQKTLTELFLTMSGDEKFYAAALFKNDLQRPDGNCWGFSTFSRNLDVDGFPYGFREIDVPSERINITRTRVYDLECAPLEVVALTSSNVNTVTGRRTIPIVDVRGSTFSVLQVAWDPRERNYIRNNFSFVAINVVDGDNVSTAEYIGTPVTNAQAIVGKAVLAGVMNESLSTFNVRRSTFNKDILTWIAAAPGSRYSKLGWYVRTSLPARSQRQFICNGDEGFRVQMGVAGFRLASTWEFYVSDSKVKGLRNYGISGIVSVCDYTNTTRSHPNAVLTGYGGSAVRGFVVASCRGSSLVNNYVRWAESAYGSAVGFDILTDSQDMRIKDCAVRDVLAARWVDPKDTMVYEDAPTPWPTSIGFHVDQRATNVELLPYCVNALYAPYGDTYKTSVSQSTTSGGEWDGCHRGDEPWWIWLILAIVCLIFLLALVAILMACMDGGGGDNTYQEMKNV